MPDNRILFEGEFDPSEIRKGIDDMIDTFKKAQAQGDLSNVTLAKMQGAIDGVTEAATNLQAATGKTSIAGALGDGSLVPKLADVRKNVDEVSKSVTSAVDKAKAKVAEVKKSQDSYKDTIKATSEAIKQNEKEIDQLNKKLTSLNTGTKAGAAAARELKKEIDGIRQGNIQYGQQLTSLKKGLDDTTAAYKVQQKELKAAETAGNGFAKGLGTVFGGLRKIAYLIPGIGLAGLIGIITGPVIDAFEEWWDVMNKTSDALKLLKANQSNLNEVMANADKAAGKQVTDLKILYQAATDVNLPMKERLNAVRALQEEFPEYFKNIKAEAILNGDAKSSYDALTLSILATARATAAKAKLDELEAQKLDKDYEKQKVLIATTNEFTEAQKAGARTISIAGGGGGGGGVGGVTLQQTAEEHQNELEEQISDRQRKRLAKISDDKKDIQAQEDFIIKAAGLNNIAKVIEKTDDKKLKQKKVKEIENIYEKELQALKADIAKLDEKGFTDEASITKGIEEDFKKRSLAFDKAFKNKQLTAPQLASLKTYLGNLQELTLNQQLKGFREQRAAYLQAINDEITSVQAEESTKRIAALQDSFERERQTIIAETDKTILALEQKRDKQIADILKNASKNGLTAADVQPQIDKIKESYSKLIDDLGIIKNQKLQQLSFDTFEKLSEDAKRLLNSGNLGVSQGSLINIQKQTDLYLAGKISYQKYQKELTAIAHFETNERFLNEKRSLEAQIALFKKSLALGEVLDKDTGLSTGKKLTADQTTKLQDQIVSLQQQLADATKGNDISNAGDKNKDTITDKFAKYAEAIGNIAQSVIKFWQEANDAEVKALERSIAIQDRRVEAARNIAAKGNAEYLRLEEERQQKLLIKQENAAKRTLAINAAMQASQILVAISGAIASAVAATGPGAPFVIAGDIAAIVGALAAGYGIVKSLSSQQPSFFVGTEDTGTGGQADGKGGFHAVLHPHERVVTAEDNKKLKGISNADLIRAVEQHRVMAENWATPRMPELNLAAMDMANHVVATENIRLASIMEENNQELRENNELQRKSIKILKAMGMSVSMDRHGFAASFMQSVEEMKRTQKS